MVSHNPMAVKALFLLFYSLLVLVIFKLYNEYLLTIIDRFSSLQSFITQKLTLNSSLGYDSFLALILKLWESSECQHCVWTSQI